MGGQNTRHRLRTLARLKWNTVRGPAGISTGWRGKIERVLSRQETFAEWHSWVASNLRILLWDKAAREIRRRCAFLNDKKKAPPTLTLPLKGGGMKEWILRNYSDEKSRARASWNPPKVSGFKVI